MGRSHSKSIASRLWSLVGAAAVLATAACTGAASAGDRGSSFPPLTGGEPRLDPQVITAADPRVMAMPLAAYVWDDASVRIVNRARILVGDRCMLRFGFTPLPWTPEGQSSMVDWARYGLWDSAALELGYQGPATTDNRYPVRFMDRDASLVYFGEIGEYKGIAVPPSGCQGQEFVEVFAPVGVSFDDLSYVGDLVQESRARAKADSRVASRLASWTSCMRSAGWSYSDVLEPFNYWATRRGPDKAKPVVSADEKRNVRDDLACKSSTGLLGTWLAADIAYQKAIIEHDGERLREFRQELDAILANANTILAAG